MIITFQNVSLNEHALQIVPSKVTVLKHYGRRLVIDCTPPYDWLWPYFGGEQYVQNIEQDLVVGMSSHPVSWNLNESEPYSLHIGDIRTKTNGTAVVSVLDSGLPQVAQDLFKPALGYSFITMNSENRNPNFTDVGDCAQSNWHGVHVVSVLNDVAPGSTLLILRVLDSCGTGFASDITDAIVWAVGGKINGIDANVIPAHVISMSFSGLGSCPTYLQSAVSQALSLGSVIVAAAGNSAENAQDYFPGNCDGVITLGATTRQGTLASYSNWGPTLTFSAPGGDVQDPISVLTFLDGHLIPGFAIGTSRM